MYNKVTSTAKTILVPEYRLSIVVVLFDFPELQFPETQQCHMPNAWECCTKYMFRRKGSAAMVEAQLLRWLHQVLWITKDVINPYNQSGNALVCVVTSKLLKSETTLLTAAGEFFTNSSTLSGLFFSRWVLILFTETELFIFLSAFTRHQEKIV